MKKLLAQLPKGPSNWTTVLSTKANGPIPAFAKVKAFKCGQTVQNLKATGAVILSTAKGELSTQMAIFMRECGSTIAHMVKGST